MRASLIGVILALYSAGSSAAAELCGHLVSLHGAPANSCQCKGELERFSLQSPYKDLPLVAVCNYKERLWEGGGKEIHGDFFFRGKQTFSGTIVRYWNDAMGVEMLVFRGENLVPTPFSGDFVDLRFEDIKGAAEQFRTPELSNKLPCLKAQISFAATEILALPGDSDEAGNYVRGYEPVKIGKYNACKKAP